MNTAFVKIWGVVVGAVAWDEATGIATFEYDPAFKRKGWGFGTSANACSCK